MRALRMSLILTAAIAALQACAHPPTPAPAAAAVAAVSRAAAIDARDRARARQMIQENLNPGFKVQTLQLLETAQPRVFRCMCTVTYKWEGAVCRYALSGVVDFPRNDWEIEREEELGCT